MTNALETAIPGTQHSTSRLASPGDDVSGVQGALGSSGQQFPAGCCVAQAMAGTPANSRLTQRIDRLATRDNMMNIVLTDYQLTVMSLSSSQIIPGIDAGYCKAVLTPVPLFGAGEHAGLVTVAVI